MRKPPAPYFAYFEVSGGGFRHVAKVLIDCIDKPLLLNIPPAFVSFSDLSVRRLQPRPLG